ncbi:MAG: DUF1284 domain-containing protein [Methanomassiliicoccales archaeon]|nr:DUF1284 domain-containing protein [Methanomassiliicoccales archaeon]
MSDAIRLRPHHLLCHRLFSGHGYDRTFVDNMRAVIAKLESDPSVRVEVSPGCDDICAACLHQVNGACDFGASVLAKDAAVAKFLHAPQTFHLSARKLDALLEYRIKRLDVVGSVCGECEWSEACNRQLAIVKSRH